MGREPLHCQSAVAAAQASPPVRRSCSDPLCSAWRKNSRFGANLFAAEVKRAEKRSQDLCGKQGPAPALRGGDDNCPRPKPSVVRAGWRAPAQWLRAGGYLVVVVTGEAVVGCRLEPGWGRKREVGAERCPCLPAPSHGKMKQVNACAGALLHRREVRSQVWAGAVRCTSL